MIAWLLLFAADAWARPEYATREKVDCAQCHFMPWGSGPRTVFGKNYGSHGGTVAETSASDLYYGDVRTVLFLPLEDAATSPNGYALMEAAVAASVPLIHRESGTETRAVLSYNIASLSGANPREVYLRFRTEGPTPWYFTLGRFYVPFGLRTDEHRTYTRIQTNMTFNNFSMGLAASGDPLPALHADLALVNDFQSGGSFTTRGIAWGTVGNVRWNPPELPLLLGASGTYEYQTLVDPPFATSLYAVLSADRLTNNSVSGSLQLERVDAWHWNTAAVNTGQLNPGLPAFFGTAPDSASLGYYGLARWNVSPRIALFYKLDRLSLDKRFADDAFWRNGAGLEAFVPGNLILNARVEFPSVPFNAPQSGTLASQKDFFLMVRWWI